MSVDDREGRLLEAALAAAGPQAYRFLADPMPFTVWTHSPDGHIDYANQQWYDYTELPPGLTVREAWAKIVPPDDLARILPVFEESLRCGTTYEFEQRLRPASASDDGYRWHLLRCSPLRDTAGGIVKWFCTAIDIHDQRTAAEAREAAMHTIAETVPQLVWASDARGTPTYVNSRWPAFTGKSAESLIDGSAWPEIIHPDDRSAAESAWQAALSSGAQFDAELRLRNADGQYHWMLSRANPVRDHRGAIVQWVGSLTDIDDRRRSADRERYLARAGTILSSFLNVSTTLANLAQFVAGRLGDFCFVDIVEPDRLRRAGWAHADPQQRSLAARIGSFSPRPEHLEHPVIATLASGGTTFVPQFDEDCIRRFATDADHEQLVRDLDIYSWITVPLTARGRTIGALTVCTSGHSRRRFDEHDVALIEDLGRRAGLALDNARLFEGIANSERRYHELADLMPQIVWTTDAVGNADYVNRRWAEYTGLPPEAAHGKGFEAVVHPDDLDIVRRSWEAAKKSNQPFSYEVRSRRADGAYRWHLRRGVPVRDGEGAVWKWIGTTTDIDDRKRLEEENAFFSRLSDLLARSLGLRETLDRLLQIIVPEFADWANVVLVQDGGRLELAATHHVDAGQRARLRKFVGQTVVPDAQAGASAQVLRTGRPMLHETNVDPLLASWTAAGYADILRDSSAQSAVAVPLTAGGAIYGTVSALWCRSDRRFTQRDLNFFEEIGRRASGAIENARVYERQLRIASTFQLAALPELLPDVPNLRLYGYYAPGRTEAQIGGDWYDAFPLEDGRTVFSIGDVTGSGLAAAVSMLTVRKAIRAAAYMGADPITLLSAADRSLRAEHPNRLVTAVVAVLDDAATRLTFASAGHPPPLIRYPDGSIDELAFGGLPLGFPDRPVAVSATVAVPVGSWIVFHTDGLTEATRDIAEGEERLRAALADQTVIEANDPAHAIADHVLVEAAQDDVAILVVIFERNPDARPRVRRARSGRSPKTQR